MSAAPAALPGRPELVIFDLDGCLVDSEPLALAELVAVMGDAGVVLGIDEARERFLGTTIETAAAFAEARGSSLAGPAFVEAWHDRLLRRYVGELRPMPGAAALLAALDAAGLPFALATGGSVRRMGHALEVTGLARFFAPGRAHSADAVAAGKPAPDLFLLAAASAGADPGRCLVVEDAPAGVIAAVRAGMVVEGFVGGSHLEGRRGSHACRLSGLGARAVHDDLASLARRLGVALPADPA